MELVDVLVWSLLATLAVAIAYRVDTSREDSSPDPWGDQ